ncbi:CbiD protein [Granulibacter bethesdensis]|uniref:Cobalt-precorrin-5B C(1)-methyltransferase n=1 Tax=Granulibacter bethesdensis TaxID=364410 RepID=A0AAN0RCM1_9PROT|nr:cobalt-precorrin-5B (C(1))-methyltransferase [Granulibacter bethesdensis]AHJ62449.1 CbiD protein [Granulibacter bethesdensis]
MAMCKARFRVTLGAVTSSPSLRRGWTTGACATAAARAAFSALHTGHFPDPVEIALPGGARPLFALADHRIMTETPDGIAAMAGVIKDAGDDPDVTHGAMIRATVRSLPDKAGLVFRAGAGVGTITRPGLPLPPGEPAINPVPRQMMAQAITEEAARLGCAPSASIEISIDHGSELAERTLNGRLGIVGGLSVLGTTGIVVPFSCSAWIDSIHRGIDVARASGLRHIAGSTGHASEQAVKKLYALPDTALIEMGDFVGGMLKYLRRHPLPRLSIAGGIAKITKLAQGRLDLHSRRGHVDMEALGNLVSTMGGSPALAAQLAAANTTPEAFAIAAGEGFPLGGTIARRAWETAASQLQDTGIMLDVVIFSRDGQLMGRHEQES